MPENHLKFHSSNGKRRILVIEDEMVNLEILKMLLLETYDVVFAETGAAALEVLETEADILSLILLDLNLPDMKGLDILRRIKQDPSTSLLPVIVMTADSDAEVECLNMGATDFIPKPYPKQEVVLARILRTIELYEDRDIIRWTERDQLTGLYNREYFYRYAAQLDTYHKDTEMDAIVLDINHFHMINERYGRAYGDELLRRVGEILRESVQANGGIVCRREADTFLVYCPHLENYEHILDELSDGMGEDTPIRTRMGVYSRASRDIDIERRFDRAKLAADTVRSSYSRAVAIYDSSMHEKEVFDEQLLEGFSAAIQEKQFTVHYQPKFDIRGQEPILNSAEALVRWKHPELGMVSPGVFIPLFEENGLIRELDSYVWREAAAQIRSWKNSMGQAIPVSINVSRIDLYDPKLLEMLENLVTEYGLSHDELLLEITESAYTENSEQIISVVSDLRNKGFHIEMDDFGTGYSSLNMISALPIDALKLDMQFIRTAFKERKDTRLLEAVIGLAKSLEFPTIAEGVETAEQMFTLKSMGCDIVQGYYFSKPLPPEEFEEYVKGLDAGEDPEGREAVRRFSAGPKDKFTYDAMHDPLTGLYNHSAFDILFHDSDKDHIAVMIATVDEYDEMRSSRGKAFGDRVIARVADVLKSNFRSADDICRLREDEFAIIMSRMNQTMQKQVFDKIELINDTLKEPVEDLPSISLSVGIAFSDREDPRGDVFEDADTALKRMKQMRQSGFAVY